jgi:ADP-ribose pyrophosphatase YjhB (NUDIX family)
VLKERLYYLLGWVGGACFNLLNVFLRGNLPPFGSVCVVIKEHDRYLVLESMDGYTVLPGGFMRWKEEPLETARRECREETGLEVRPLDLVECFSCPSRSFARMSTLTLVYTAEVVGGSLRQAVEGRPSWYSEIETQRSLGTRYQPFFAGYLRHQRQADAAAPVVVEHDS